MQRLCQLRAGIPAHLPLNSSCKVGLERVALNVYEKPNFYFRNAPSLYKLPIVILKAETTYNLILS